MTRPLCSTGITPLHHYKETGLSGRTPLAGEGVSFRCGSAVNYYEAVRPSPAHRYFRPRGWSRLCLVWGFDCQAVSERRSAISFFFSSSVSLFDPENHVSSPPTPQYCKAGASQELSRLVRHTNLSTSFALARPYLDSSEHGGTLDAIRITIGGGSPLSGAQINRRGVRGCSCKPALGAFVERIPRAENGASSPLGSKGTFPSSTD